MSRKHSHEPGPMPYTRARHLLNPLRNLILSPQRLVRRLNLKPDSIVLELGPGPGFFSLEAARTVPEGKLILLDIQPEMLAMARERLEKQGLKNVQYQKGDAVALPLKSASVDAVFLSSVLGEVPDRETCLREIHRVLRPDGLLSVTEHKGDPHLIPRPEMITAAQARGFRLSDQYGHLLHYTVNFRKST